MKRFLRTCIVLLSCFGMSLSAHQHSHDKDCSKIKSFTHSIQLQLADSLGFPVPGTEFWVQLDIIKQGDLVTILFPVINFETGPVSIFNPYYPSGLINFNGVKTTLPRSGGYLYTANGFLPEELCPNNLVPRSIVAASNNGQSPLFSFTQDPATLPNPPAGYIVQVTNGGALVVQCAGTFGNIIPAGPQILLPCSITYVVKERQKLRDNVKISKGATNVTQFTTSGHDPAGTGLRDSHFNDAFDNVVAWAWTDNSMIDDKTNGTLNCMVSIGKVDKEGKLKPGKPIQLTNLNPGVFAWDTAVAINRTNKKNIVVSYSVLNAPGTPFRAVSFDGGKTWPENGPLNIAPSGNPSGNGDCRGVASDKFGNIWYSTTNLFDDAGNEINQPYFAASRDGGVTFELIYTVALPSLPPGVFLYDYPQYCFGTDAQGNYGLYFVVDGINNATLDCFPAVGFIPITGLGQFGSPQFAFLQGLNNTVITDDITASADGRLWIQSIYSGAVGPPFSYVQPTMIGFRSPGGTLDLNWAGAWHQAVVNNFAANYVDNRQIPVGFPLPTSFHEYLLASVQSILFDDSRQALYAMVSQQVPYYSQSMRIFFSISRDNGQTWSDPIDISTTSFANRGLQSMALDSKTGNLIFGWYDGRHDQSLQSVEYFGAVLPAKTLDKHVTRIPLANPVYALPSVATAGEGMKGKVPAKPPAASQKRLKN